MAPPKRNPRSARGEPSAIRKPQSAARRPSPPSTRHRRSLAASIGPSDIVKGMIERLHAQAASFGLLDPLDVEPALVYEAEESPHD